MSYNRYSKFLSNGKYKIVPSVTLTKRSTDYFEIYNQGSTRLDIISDKYYGDANYDWLIMMANPEYGSMEFSIPNGTMLRIPYPLSEAIADYERKIDLYNTLNNK